MDWIEWAQYGAAAMAVIALWLLLVVATRAKRKAESKIDPPEPIQAYDRFPEPKPMKTVETRDDKDIPY